MRVQRPSGYASSGIRHRLRVEKPTIKILFYTDDPVGIKDDDSFLGLRSLRFRLQAHKPAAADFGVDFVSRSSTIANHADNKIDVVLDREVKQTGQPFDEIWFFGTHQTTTTSFAAGALGGGPQSELDAGEVDALRQWLDVRTGVGGGVMISGDHSEKRPNNAVTVSPPVCEDDSSADDPLALGRALGRCVPRAGLMRKWAGGPTSTGDNHNTVVGGGLQQDGRPQTFRLVTFDASGHPNLAGSPHPLFFYRANSFINVLPDHDHEGALVDVFDPTKWPIVKGVPQPLPQVVAVATNQRNQTEFNLLSAYDGDSVDVGRIVADSSWHHYLGGNLGNFPHPAPANTEADKIGQFYGNLGLWLAPRSKRTQMAQALLWELANLALVMGEYQEDRLGTFAYITLLQMASPCEIHEFFNVLVNDSPENASEMRGVLNQFRGSEVLLGGILSSYHREIRSSRVDSDNYEAPTPDVVIQHGINRAVELRRISR
jgi:hypothetical protein